MNYLTFISAFFFIFLACSNADLNSKNNFVLSEKHKSYWYDGNAEITGYELKQSRYGEIRTGTAVMIFVTEDFSLKNYTKSDAGDNSITSVLKLNFVKNFTTGIYPYSIMTSVFMNFSNPDHAIKISTSVQEWCGHVYMELLKKKKYECTIHSYFENESANSVKIPIGYTEDELWTLIRIDPNQLPEGNHQIIPSFSYLRLMHKELKPYPCETKVSVIDSVNSQIKLFYSDLERELIIQYTTDFPHQIIKWSETYPDGLGSDKKVMTSYGEKIKTIKLPYWKLNTNSDSLYRKELGLN